MAHPSYYECKCGFYHAVGNEGCGDDAACFIVEELDETHGKDGWEEIYREEEEPAPAPPPAKRHKNYDRMMAVNAETDINGQKIEVGCKVRSFSCPHYDAENDWLIGLDTTGRCSFFEGKIIEIAEHKPTFAETASLHYLIEMEREVYPIIERTRSDFAIRDETQTRLTRGRIWIPANGTVVKGVKVENYVYIEDPDAPDWKLFGVLKI